jgi:hypothetical protein
MLAPPSVAGGNPVIGTITISGPAPPAGFRVRLASSNPERAQPPSELQIAPGQQSGTFSIQTFPINRHPDVVDPDPTTTISATPLPVVRLAQYASAGLTVTPAALTGFTITSPIPSGTAATATVMLNGPAPSPSGITLALSSDGPSDLSMPSSITIPPGGRTADFTITPDPDVFGRAFVIQARRSTFDTDQAALSVRIPWPERLYCPGRPFQPIDGRLAEFTGGNDVDCVVLLDGPAPYDAYGITLTSDDPAYALVEKTVYVDKGERETDVLVMTKPVTVPRTITVSGMAAGITKSVSFRLLPVGLKRVVVEPDPVMGGQIANVTVELSGPALAPLSVAIDSSHPSIFELLTPITIAVNETLGSREVQTAEVDEDRVVMATARIGAQSVQRQFVVERTTRPDLTVGFAQLPRQYIVINVLNIGDADAPPSTLKVETFKGEELLASNLVTVGAINHESTFPPSNYRQILINNVAGQSGRWVVYADALNEIEEGQEGNNTAEYSLY